MAKCRISNLTPPCGYNVQGIVDAWLMDFEDFGGFEFANDAREDVALVQSIFGGGAVRLPVSGATKYSSSMSGRMYAHTLETFIPSLSSQIVRDLNLASRRRYIVIFTTSDGRRFVFGYESGAKLSYSGQTTDAVGAAVTLSAASIHPLFELTADAYIGVARDVYDIDFNFGAFCEQS